MSAPYHTTKGTTPSTLELHEDPLSPGDLMVVANGGVTVRVRLVADTAFPLADAIKRFYSHEEES